MTPKAWTLPPFGLVLAAMGYLLARFEELPDRYPVHWGVSGQADRWVQKSTGAILLPGGLGLGVLLMLAFTAWQLEKSTRGSAKAARWMVGMEWAVGLLFVVVVLLPVLGPMGRGGTLAMILIPTALVVAVAIGVSRESWKASPAPPGSWKWGVFYYNPEDPDLVVPKRTGLGYTLNFGHRASWWILMVLAAVIALPLIMLR